MKKKRKGILFVIEIGNLLDYIDKQDIKKKIMFKSKDNYFKHCMVQIDNCLDFYFVMKNL